MMKRIHKTLVSTLLAVGIGTGALAVQAQPSSNGQAAGHHERSPEKMRERMEKRQAELRAKLALNANQETAWNAYVARMRPGDMPQRPDRAEMEKLSVPDRMEKRLAFMKQAEQRMTERLAATREFYAVLSPDQQKIFNEEFKFHGRSRHDGPEGHHGGAR